MGKLVFEEERTEVLQKKQCTVPITTQNRSEEGSIVVVRQHRREPSHKLELLRTWKPPINSSVAQHGATMETQSSFSNRDKGKNSTNGKNKMQTWSS